MHNDYSFVNFELYLVKIIMYLLIFIFDRILYDSLSYIIKKNVGTNSMNI